MNRFEEDVAKRNRGAVERIDQRHRFALWPCGGHGKANLTGRVGLLRGGWRDGVVIARHAQLDGSVVEHKA